MASNFANRDAFFSTITSRCCVSFDFQRGNITRIMKKGTVFLRQPKKMVSKQISLGIQQIRGYVVIHRLNNRLHTSAPLCFSDYGSIEPTTSAESRFETFEQINSLLRFHMKPSKRQPPDSPHRIQGHFPHPKKGHKELPYERLQNITKKRTWNSCATQVGTLRSRGGISFRKDLSTLGWFRWGFRSDVEFTTWPLTLIPSQWGNCHRIKKITIGRSHFFFVSILLVVRTQPWWPMFFGVKASEDMIVFRFLG